MGAPACGRRTPAGPFGRPGHIRGNLQFVYFRPWPALLGRPVRAPRAGCPSRARAPRTSRGSPIGSARVSDRLSTRGPKNKRRSTLPNRVPVITGVQRRAEPFGDPLTRASANPKVRTPGTPATGARTGATHVGSLRTPHTRLPRVATGSRRLANAGKRLRQAGFVEEGPQLRAHGGCSLRRWPDVPSNARTAAR